MTSPQNYGLVHTVEELDLIVNGIIDGGEPFGLDIETGYSGPDKEGASLAPDYPESFIVGISISGHPSWARYIPIAHDLSTQNLDQERVARVIWDLVSTGNAIIHNVGFELRFMAKWFVEMLGAEVVDDGYFPFLADSMLMSYLAAETEFHGLKALNKILFDYDQPEIVSLFGDMTAKQTKSLRFNLLELTKAVIDYCCEDAARALLVYYYFLPKVGPGTPASFLYQVEHKIVPVLCRMEDYGLQYDWTAMRAKAREAERFIVSLNTEIQQILTEMTGTPQSVNIASPAQLRAVLYDELGFKTTRKTATGTLSTDEQSLTWLAEKYPVVRKILEWKQMKKLLGTYLEKYERVYRCPECGRTHPDHNQVRVPTGRFAVSDPPYQQSPKKYHYELSSGEVFECDFRTFITAPPDHYILGFDFSQVELRMLAGDAQEPALLDAFFKEEDVHVATAALMLRKPKEQINKEDRAKGKTMNFALLYGMGIASLAERLAVDVETAQQLNDSYFAAYSKIDEWVDKVQTFGRDNQFVVTRFGRKVAIWEYERAKQPGQGWQDSKGDRACMNYPIQGAAADYMKIAMIRADAAIRRNGYQDRVHLVMNIHDALEFYVHNSVSPQEIVDLLAPEVSFPVEGLPPIVAEWHMGQNWGEVTELKVVDGKLVDTGEAPEREEYAPDNAEAVATHKEAAPVEGMPGTWSYCGSQNNHSAHRHTVSFNGETPITDVLCKGFPGDPTAAVPYGHIVYDIEPVNMRGTTKWEPEQALRPPRPAQRRFMIIVESPPTPDKIQSLLSLLQTTPGENEVLLKIADNPPIDVKIHKTSLSPDDLIRFSMVLGAVSAEWVDA